MRGALLTDRAAGRPSLNRLVTSQTTVPNSAARTLGRRCVARVAKVPEQTAKDFDPSGFPASASEASIWGDDAVQQADAGRGAAASTSDTSVPPKELVAEKAREGMKRFSASNRKVGESRLIVDSLKRVSITLLCDDHDLAHAVAKIVGSRLGWFPVDHSKVICGMRKVTDVKQLTPQDLADAEAEILKGLRNQFRVIATPFPGASIARETTWNDLYGSVIIWLDEEDKTRPKPASEERALYGRKAEVTARVKVQKGFAAKGGNPFSLENRARAAADALLPRLSEHLAEFPALTERKRQYVERGCRGDWPEVQPAGWSPVVQTLERKPLAGFEATAA
ncbi:hypothetical protein HYH03_017101 [Edaphochlamys debaryana]|uniref:Uncharacterized protein n=1 Tax=Edaphochlamys debaryana TaxID=47281 RepID=A0A835XGB1_9CHLO|nr:hypothetical protein HYH03_017101 [Edaphochlamys debaryana]|eukprot:KAG2484082.1 hypothetical protein HYH03_017101 [Edaphochlamys debaryana]